MHAVLNKQKPVLQVLKNTLTLCSLFSPRRQILIEFCAGGAVDAVMLGESAFPLCIQVITSTRKVFTKQH